MAKNNLPTYLIVELLIRLSPFNAAIGDYKNHTHYDEGVLVKTTNGTIHFTKSLLNNQFKSPELITDEILIKTASSFAPFA